MDDSVFDPDAPNVDLSKKNEADGHGSDSEDEAAPDFGQLAALASRAQAKQGLLQDDSTNQNTQFIPKRGDKDFEPTGFTGQKNALENSRKAMFDVISSQRIINSKSISIATWHPQLSRAIVHLVRGQTFASMGVSRRVAVLEDGQFEDLAHIYQKEGKPIASSRLELLPEEALYLVERGSLECRIYHKSNGSGTVEDMRDYDDIVENPEWVPMSLEQAFSTILGVDGLTRPHYQLYAYLKRLGYIVQRKSISDQLRKINAATNKASRESFETEGIIADPHHPLRLLTIFDLLLYPIRRIVQIASHGLNRLQGFFRSLLQRLRNWFSKVTAASTNTSFMSRPGLLGIGTSSFSGYDEVFDRLRIVPTGHDAKLIRPELKQQQDVAPEIFYYAWRPATHFKKSDPPLPEYQLAVMDVRHTSLPSAFAFADLFEHIPVPLSTQDWEQMDEEEQRVWKMAEEQRKRNNESYGKGAVRKAQALKQAKEAQEQGHDGVITSQISSIERIWHRFVSLLGFISTLFAHLPPGYQVPRRTKGRHAQRGGQQNRLVNVYGPLKSGRRNIIVAVNDCGTTSLLRFGEAEFERWRIAGTERQGR
ncbi:uncharacterized protein FA14DRAFT_127159 [Meira miltonrushii]|uniref:tRNA-splicing endonuclease subunit Sen54 N-terminal domain-containing protein n=1 Tax=Meira miltonrushii TaxID=1280837 RepID=A0A316V417_9BASI|nr:uncharacterized protein FA14DRAFT_127159 [Meira miltonrushii]PWN32299.1 hypothetical protein FA14DRAFT_127159 [Meira miltonrushii]